MVPRLNRKPWLYQAPIIPLIARLTGYSWHKASVKIHYWSVSPSYVTYRRRDYSMLMIYLEVCVQNLLSFTLDGKD